jgi:prepilin-type N-terminal cleavage/methylation domain-containing protein
MRAANNAKVCLGHAERVCRFVNPQTSCERMARRGFSLIELLVVIAVISLLTGILLPGLSKARYQARRIIGGNNQRQVIRGAGLFALDNDDQYPESVATIGDDTTWNWQEPMMLTGYRARSPRLHRSMSAYLRRYIEDADAIYCPSAPRKYKYLDECWEAGDAWDNPNTPPVEDPVSGTYCFYWNYTGYLEDRSYLFRGPRNSAGGSGQSKLLVSDYFAYDHWRSENAYSSCEKFSGSSVTEGTELSSAYWSQKPYCPSAVPQFKLQAGYTDGHVESFSSLDTAPMRVILYPATGEPYPEDISPGTFLLPQNALR